MPQISDNSPRISVSIRPGSDEVMLSSGPSVGLGLSNEDIQNYISRVRRSSMPPRPVESESSDDSLESPAPTRQITKPPRENVIVNLKGKKFSETDIVIYQGKNRLAKYHKIPRLDLATESTFAIGFEVEKEDETVEIDFEKVFNETSYAVERDGSIDFNTGYELVSPILPFDNTSPIHKQEAWIKKYIEPVEHLLNTKFSDRCGLHFHLSHREKDKFHIYNEMKYIIHVLYAIYPERAVNRYCKATKHNHDVGNKYHALSVRRNTIEFRIFDALPSMKDLLDRIELLRIMINMAPITNSYSDLYNKLLDDNDLTKLLKSKFVKDYDKFMETLVENITKLG